MVVASVRPLKMMAVGQTEAAMADRGAERLRLHGAAARLAQHAPRSFLEVNSVSEGTVREYAKRVWEFSQWAGVAEVGSLSAEELDGLLVEFLDEAYFRGRNHDTAEKLLAALQFTCEGVRLNWPTSVPRALRVAAGFKRLAPGHSRAPLPWTALLALAGAAYAEGTPLLGLALIVQFVGYLQPSELLNLTRRSVIASEGGRVGETVSLLLAPWELGETGKTGEFDESVVLRRPELPALTGALRAMARREPKSGNMFGLSYCEYTRHFHRLARCTGVALLEPHPYSIRHGLPRSPSGARRGKAAGKAEVRRLSAEV